MIEQQIVFKHSMYGEDHSPGINNNPINMFEILHAIWTFKINLKCLCVFQYGTQLYQNYIQPHQKQKASPMVR